MAQAAKLPWVLDKESKQALKSAVENADPAHMNRLASIVAGRIKKHLPPTKIHYPIGQETASLGYDMVKYVHNHPLKLVVTVMLISGVMFTFVKGMNYLFGVK